MHIKRHIIILIATFVLSVPAIHIKQIHQDNQSTERQTKATLSIAIVKKAELDKKLKLEEEKRAELARLAKVEAERVAAVQAAQAAEAERVRVAQVKVQEAAVAQAKIANCGPQDPTVIYQVLTSSGVPRVSAIQLLGSWKHESGGDFNHCQRRGDGGIAWGLNSWHPGRRHDMPSNLKDQVLWAVHTEMKRDCSTCYQTVMAGGSVWSVRSAIQKSTRWGIEGNRWTYADQFANRF